jgi:starvation-inducible outer membrane lipoprotein
MSLRLMLAALLMVATAACSTYHKEIDGNPPFAPHHFRYYDLEVAWQSEQTGQGIRLTGTVTNHRSYYLRDLELTARLVDSHGKVLSRETFSDFPVYLSTGKTEPFRLEIRVPSGTAPERVRFTYVYWLTEEPPAFRGYDDVPYFGNFDSPL